MADDDTAQHGQTAFGAVAMGWSRTEAFSMVTWVRRMAQVGGSNAVIRV
jgi:hypothetical protein